MRTLSPFLALSLVAGMAAATPAFANSGGQDEFPITFSAPGPRSMLDTALDQLHARDLRGAASTIELTQNRLISDSLARRLPAEDDPIAYREAVPVLDLAVQALGRGDAAGAEQAVNRARAMI